MTFWSGDTFVAISANIIAVLVVVVAFLIIIEVYRTWIIGKRIQAMSTRIGTLKMTHAAELVSIRQDHAFDNDRWGQELDCIKQQISALQAAQDVRIAESAFVPRYDRIQRFLTLSPEDYEAYQDMEEEVSDLLSLFPPLAADDIPEREQLL